MTVANAGDDESPKTGLKARAQRAWAWLKSLGGPLAVVASLFGIASGGVWVSKLFVKDDYVRNIEATFVCVIGLIFVALSIYLQYQLYQSRQKSVRARRLALAQTELVAAHMHISRAAASLADDDPSREDLRLEGVYATQRLASAFSIIAGAPCRVTVKQLFSPPGDDRLAVKDLFRSHPTNPSGTGVDWVAENTDFEEVLAKGRKYWACDDIVDEFGKRYRNSHITQEQATSGDVPYRSVLVVRVAEPVQPPEVVLGFVCVDSLSRGIFRPRFDVSAAESFAHALYSVMTWYRKRELEQQQPGAKHAAADADNGQ